jgi:Thioesterase-like superfamily
MKAIYRVDGNKVEVSPNAAGPWDPRMQHGSAPAALCVWAAEAIPTPVEMRIARVTIDLMRPVPLVALTLHTEVLRMGRKIQLCAVRLLADGVVVVAASVLKVRRQAQPLPSDIAELPVMLPGPAWPASRSANGSCSMRRRGSAPKARGYRWRGLPTSAAISAAPWKASWSRSGRARLRGVLTPPSGLAPPRSGRGAPSCRPCRRRSSAIP